MQGYFRRVRQSWLVMVALALFLVGLILARLRLGSQEVVLIMSIFFGVSLLLLRSRRKGYIFVIIFVCSLGFGYCRGAVYLDKVDAYQSMFGETITLQATAL